MFLCFAFSVCFHFQLLFYLALLFWFCFTVLDRRSTVWIFFFFFFLGGGGVLGFVCLFVCFWFVFVFCMQYSISRYLHMPTLSLLFTLYQRELLTDSFFTTAAYILNVFCLFLSLGGSSAKRHYNSPNRFCRFRIRSFRSNNFEILINKK